MLCLVLFVSIFGSVISEHDTEDLGVYGVVGGSNALPGQIPYQVGIWKNGGHGCGGTLISDRVVLTAAHCVHAKPADNLTIALGSIYKNRADVVIPVERYEEHLGYVYGTEINDVALVFLKTPVKFDKFIQKAELPEQDEKIPNGIKPVVSGWGMVNATSNGSPYLQYVRIPIWTEEDCKPYQLGEYAFCAGDKSGKANSCAGDSGGPLVYNNKVIGIVSHGYVCGENDRAAVYMRVSAYRDWIRDVAHI